MRPRLAQPLAQGQGEQEPYHQRSSRAHLWLTGLNQVSREMRLDEAPAVSCARWTDWLVGVLDFQVAALYGVGLPLRAPVCLSHSGRRLTHSEFAASLGY